MYIYEKKFHKKNGIRYKVFYYYFEFKYIIIIIIISIRPPSKNRAKVQLKPGFHLTDWMRLSQVSQDLSGRGNNPIRKISMKELSEHKTKYDCWIAYNNRVYNVSPYLPYHPGGEEIILQWAGKDCTKVFNKFHAWVNCDSMLNKCYLGPLGTEQESLKEDDEEEEEDDNNNDRDIDDNNKNDNEVKKVTSIFSSAAFLRAKEILNEAKDDDDVEIPKNVSENSSSKE